MLIAGQSGRALAQAAVRAGYAPLVADLFGDSDTRESADDVREIQSLGGEILVPALDALAEGRSPAGLVLGSGFEDRTELIATLDERFGIIGNDAATIARVKDPIAFAGACASLGLPHPAVRLDEPGKSGWVLKQNGGSGGFHVRPAAPGAAPARGWYVQKMAAGIPAGVLFLGDGRSARVLAVTAQWTDPAPQRPFRFGGAVRPSSLTKSVEASLAIAAAALTRHFGLRGLNSLDALVRKRAFTVLEINPRPGATIDLFSAWPLFMWHIEACHGVLPDVLPPLPGAAAMALVYATCDIVMGEDFAWPSWAADRQKKGSRVKAGEPLCSVHGETASADEARKLVAARAAAILAKAEQQA